MKSKRVRLALLVALVVVGAVTAVAVAGGRGGFEAKLTGAGEVPFVSTEGDAQFKARLNRAGDTIEWTLKYADLSGTPTQAHIHLGQRFANGGVVLFFCTNLAPPAGVPAPQACPAGPATISGEWTAADVVAVTAQGIAGPADFDEVVGAMRHGVTYANVHTEQSPTGEIRGQVRGNGRGHAR